MTTKLHKIETIPEERKLFSLKDENQTNLRLTDRTSKLISKRANSSLAKKGSLEKLIS